MTNSLLTDVELASRLGISVRTIRNWRLTGDGPGHLKLGKSVRYSPEAVAEWLAGCERKSTSDPGPAA